MPDTFTPNLNLDLPPISAYDLFGAKINANFTAIDTAALMLAGTPLSPTAPTTGQALVFNGTSWAPGSGGGGAATSLATTGSPVVVSAAAPPAPGQALIATSATTATWQAVAAAYLAGTPLSPTAPTPGQTLVFNGTSWAPASGSSVSSLTTAQGESVFENPLNSGLFLGAFSGQGIAVQGSVLSANPSITVQIQDGVSTANQIIAAIQANTQANALVTATTSNGSAAQSISASTLMMYPPSLVGGATGVSASRIIGDILYTAKATDQTGNIITVNYISGGTAGNEVVTTAPWFYGIDGGRGGLLVPSVDSTWGASTLDMQGASGVAIGRDTLGGMEFFGGYVVGTATNSGQPGLNFFGPGSDWHGANIWIIAGDSSGPRGANILSLTGNVWGVSLEGRTPTLTTTNPSDQLVLVINGEIHEIVFSANSGGSAVAADMQAKIRAIAAVYPPNQVSLSGCVVSFTGGKFLISIPGDGFNLVQASLTIPNFPAPSIAGQLGLSNTVAEGGAVGGYTGYFEWDLGDGGPYTTQAMQLDAIEGLSIFGSPNTGQSPNAQVNLYTGISGSAWSIFAQDSDGSLQVGSGNGTAFSITNTGNMTVYTNPGSGPSLLLSQPIQIADGTQGVSKALVSDASGNSSWDSRPFAYDISGQYVPAPTSNQEVFKTVVARAITFGASMDGSYGVCSPAATASTTFSLLNNGTQFGTMVFSPTATTATFTGTTTTAPGDVVTVVAPAVPDISLADLAFVLAGTL